MWTLLALLLTAVSGNSLCSHPDRSLGKNGHYNPAYPFSPELGGTCEMKNFVQGPTIGKGHYGVVKQAVHRATGTVVALKYLEGINPARFPDHRNEECNQHSLDGALFVKHYCTMIHDDNVVFVMEYLDGVSFREYFQSKNQLSEAQMQYYAAQMVIALEQLHAKKIIFGSLTSANIMLLRDGQLKIIDFGATMRIMPGDRIEPKPSFVSYKARPHKWKNYSHDYYSLGILLFELAYANKSKKWLDPKSVQKMKCPKVVGEAKICDLISRLFTDQYDKIWGGDAKTHEMLKRHPWFSSIDWQYLNSFAKGDFEQAVAQAPETVEEVYDPYHGQQYVDEYGYEIYGPEQQYTEYDEYEEYYEPRPYDRRYIKNNYFYVPQPATEEYEQPLYVYVPQQSQTETQQYDYYYEDYY